MLHFKDCYGLISETVTGDGFLTELGTDNGLSLLELALLQNCACRDYTGTVADLEADMGQLQAATLMRVFFFGKVLGRGMLLIRYSSDADQVFVRSGFFKAV